MTSQQRNRTPPLPRWTTSSFSPRHRTSQPPRREPSFQYRGSDLRDDFFKRKPDRNSLTIDDSPINSRVDERPCFFSRNAETVHKGGWKQRRSDAGRQTSAQRRFSPVSRVDGRTARHPGLKRSVIPDAFRDPPQAKQVRRANNRQNLPYCSRSPYQSNSDIMWHSPPTRYRSRSRERKLSNTNQPVSGTNECWKPCPPVRDFSLKWEGTNMSMNEHHHQATHHTEREEWESLTSTRYLSPSEKRFSLCGEQCNSPRLKNKFVAVSTYHKEHGNKDVSRNSKYDLSLPGKHSDQGFRNDSSSQKNRYQSKTSSKERRHSLEDDHKSPKQSIGSKNLLTNKMQTRRKEENDDRNRKDDAYQISKESTLESRSVSNDSFDQVKKVKLPEQRVSKSSRNGRGSSYSSRSKVATKIKLKDAEKNTGSFQSDGHYKAQAIEFNPDFVLLVRHSNEGERPLCYREEFSRNSVLPTDSDELKSANSVTSSADEHSISHTISPNNRNLKSHQPCSDQSITERDSLSKMKKLAEKSDRFLGFHCPADSSKNSRVCEETADSFLQENAEGDKRIVTSARTRQDSECFEERDANHVPDDRITDPSTDFGVVKKKSAFDLRHKIAKQRMMRIGKHNTSRIVRHFPTKWKSFSRADSRSWQVMAHKNYDQTNTEIKHTFAGHKVEPRRSVILKQSY